MTPRISPILGLLAVCSVVGTTARAQTQDHLSCFNVKDSAPKVKYTVTVTTAAGQQTCIVRAPAKMACVQAAKGNVTPTPPGGGPGGSSAAGAFLCYPAKCPKPVKTGTNAQDQFGNRVITFGATKLLCAPAFVAAPTPGASTTTTTTLPGTGGECTFSNGMCQGSCSGSGRCRAAANTGSCECREVSCGDADSPSCDGACSEAGEACVFGFTGCKCVRIP